MVRPYTFQRYTRGAALCDCSSLTSVISIGHGRIFHVFSGPHPKLELLRRLSASAATTRAEMPTLESAVSCIPMRNVGAVVAGLTVPDRSHGSDKIETDNSEEDEPKSTRWPPLPTIAQTVGQMQGGCDG